LQPPPFGLRLAAILCAGVGFYGFLITTTMSARLLELHRGPWVPVVADPLGALLILIAGILLWLRRAAGVALLLAGAALPPLVHQLVGGPVRMPSILLLVAAVLLMANVKHLR
jgi:hypothetical protein